MRDLLATKWGRMVAFFSLYLTEGIPLGFTAIAIATQMRRQGVGVADVGAFVGSLYLPWAFKWAAGPFVDTLSSDRWGRRRAWIIGTQLLMAATLLVAAPVDFVASFRLFVVLIVLHNVCAATMDVAIDALAVSVLPEEERGLANGFMFGGAAVGQAVGGSAVLFLTEYVAFGTTFFFVAGCILAVTLLVALPLRERPGKPRLPVVGSRLAAAGREIRAFAAEAGRSLLGSRPAFVGVIFALLPAGAYALGLALQSTLAVELGLNDNQVAQLNLYSSILFAVACVAGGWLSDRFGRRRVLALYLVGTALPTLYLAWTMQRFGWILPVDVQLPDRPPVPAELVTIFWVACLVYQVFQGLMYGARSALFMDVTNPAVAATQFTAYMAMLNLVISYSGMWQGKAAERWGYPITLSIDALAGLVSISLLPLMTVRRGSRSGVTGAVAPDGAS